MRINFMKSHKALFAIAIAALIVLAVSISFCVWDETYSIKSILANSGTGNFQDQVLLASDGDIDNSGTITVGDIVEFGHYFQDSNALSTLKKDPLRWRVVHLEGKVATLLTEKVVVFGTFYGYQDSSGNGSVQRLSQSYAASTARSWLNSIARPDRRNEPSFPELGTGVSDPRYRGFLAEAFTAKEQDIIIPKKISGLKGIQHGGLFVENFPSCTDKVWLPSCLEMNGPEIVNSKNVSNGFPDKNFQYFVNGNSKVAGATGYAMNAVNTSYFRPTDGTAMYSSTSAASYFLRSPAPITGEYGVYYRMMGVNNYGVISDSGIGFYTGHCFGIRPGVDVRLGY